MANILRDPWEGRREFLKTRSQWRDALGVHPVEAPTRIRPWFHRLKYVTLLGLMALWAQAADPVQTTGLIHPAIGSYCPLKPEAFAGVPSYSVTNRLVLTLYFYWYDVYSGAHLVNPDQTDALTDHPATLTGFSYLSRAWHQGELRDMMAAGIDVVLPVYWGEPSQRIKDRPLSAQPWSYAGLPPLVAAREELLRAGLTPPRIGLFYDTSTLQHNAAGQHIDLTTPYGRQWFYESVRDFFSLIPPQHWAMIDDKPVVFLYSASFARAHDQSCIEYLRSSFAQDFGGRVPFIVREISWQTQTEQVYAWGGALGLKNPGVASLGPGYDHSAVPGREPLVVPREDGAFFRRNWERFLSRPSSLVFIETWNEFHEGTDIAQSREYGRQYLALNRQFADMFKAGVILPRPRGRFSDARLLVIDLGNPNREAGLVQLESADGVTAAATLGGSACRILAPTSYAGHYLYLRVDDSFKWADNMNVAVVVDYYDLARGTLRLEFDGSDTNAPFQGAYTRSPESTALSGSKTWRIANFALNGARFLNQQNSGADIRLSSSIPGLGIRRVQLVRPGLKAESFTPADGFQLTLYAQPGRSYLLETSTDLVQWNPLATLTAAATATSYCDGPGHGSRWRWYRCRF